MGFFSSSSISFISRVISSSYILRMLSLLAFVLSSERFEEESTKISTSTLLGSINSMDFIDSELELQPTKIRQKTTQFLTILVV